MATLFSDDFNRANNTDLGASWTEVKGNHQIVSNALQLAAYNSANNFADCRADTDAHAAVADCKVTATRVSGTSFDALIYARGSGTDSTYTGYVLNVYGSNNIEVYRFNSGTSALIGARNATHSNGDSYGLQVSGTGATITFKVIRNGAQVGADLTDTSGSRITAAGQTGLGNWATSTSTWDDFLVEDLAAGGDVSVALTGQVATSSRGSLGPAASKDLSGSAVTSAAGTLTPSLSFVLTGRAATSAIGSIGPQLSIELTGLSATVAQGTVTASTGGDVTVSLSGLVASSAQGALSPAAVRAVTGLAITSTRGSVTPELSKALTGSAASAAQGALAPTFSLSLSGLASTLSQGTVTPVSGVTIALTGQSSTFSAGTIGVVSAIGLTGAVGTWSQGVVSAGVPSGPTSRRRSLLAEKVERVRVVTKVDRSTTVIRKSRQILH